MRLLLDTHCLLWWLAADARLKPSVRDAIADRDSTVYLSAVVLWEIRIKEALGKLKIPRDFRNVLDREEFVELPVTLDHADGVARLPDLHRDPFDRLLISQAIDSDLVLVTGDETIQRYPVTTLAT